MISLDDCVGLCGLSAAEVRAIAEHEHVPEIVAAAIAQCLIAQPDGYRRIAAMIADDVAWTRARGEHDRAETLLSTLRGFTASHPEALASARARCCIEG